MRAPSDVPHHAARRPPPSSERGYALLTVLVISVIILTGATTLALLARDSSRIGSTERKGTTAHAVAVAGLTWATSNLVGVQGTDAMQRATAGETVTLPGGVRIHPFDPDDQWAGVGLAPPPIGTSNASWQAFGDGHYALLAAVDPIDPTRAGLVRSYAVVRGVKVLLESSLIYNVLTTLPGALTGCFEDSLEVTWYDQSGPYDYVANMRIDGGLGVPWAMSADHNRVNGLARYDGSDPSPFSLAGEPTNRSWRGHQSLRGEPLASTVTNKYGGTRSSNLVNNPSVGVLAGWTRNPFLSNDPRIVDVSDKLGVGLHDYACANNACDAFVWAGGESSERETSTTYERPMTPLIATRGGPDASTYGTIANQAQWDDYGDNDARKGMYACDNHDAESDPAYQSVEACAKGTIGDAIPDFDGDALNHSGRAWGFIQSIVRQCTGSGDSISLRDGSPWYDTTSVTIGGQTAPANPNGIACARGFEWLENVAACLILPGNVGKNLGNNGRRPPGDGNNFNNFRGCHPGCLIAVDQDGDGDIDDEDRPFRSSCINLDDTTLSVYGPGVFSLKTDDDAIDGAESRVFQTPGAPLIGTLSAGSFGAGPYTTCRNIDGGYDAGENCSPYVKPIGTAFIDAWQYRHYHPAFAGFPWTTAPPATSGTNDPNFGAKGVLAEFRTDTLLNGTPPTAPSTNVLGGAVAEWGNISHITRLDMTDRGPLGTCEQNCLAYGFGRDRTYGAHRTDLQTMTGYGAAYATPGAEGTDSDPTCRAAVPAIQNYVFATSNAVQVACNVDYDQDGFLDRKSYALTSSYNPACADDHDGITYAPLVNISSSNGNLAGAGCRNEMPNFDTSVVTPIRLKPFCEDGSYQELVDAVAALESVATSITSSQLNKSTPVVEEDNGWFGGAKCHMGNRTFKRADGTIYDPHPHGGNLTGVPNTDVDINGNADYWIEDECPEPGIWRVDTNANINIGNVCGCGIMIFTDNTLMFQDSHFLWRGLVIWNLKSSGSNVINMDKQKEDTFVVQGGMLMTGVRDWRVVITKEAQSGQNVSSYSAANKVVAKQAFRFDRKALDDVFNGLRPPIRSIRRIH